MRERAITSSIVWIALAASIDRILNSMSALSSTGWQIGMGVLIFVLIICAFGATGLIWQNASQKGEHEHAAQAEKVKRDNRDARIKRLLASMDDEELDALEQGQLGDDGERLSLEALLKKRG